MIRNFLILVCLLLFNLIDAQIQHTCIPKPEPGKAFSKCYIDDYTKPERNRPEQLFVFKPTEWETVLDTLFFDPQLKGKEQRIIVKEVANQWELYSKKNGLIRCLTRDPADCLIFQFMEVPAEFITLQNDSDFHYRIINVQKIKTPSELIHLEDWKDNHQIPMGSTSISWEKDGDIYFKIRAGSWTEWIEITCPHRCQTYSIKQIQEKLKERGYYEGPIENNANPAFKSALTQFIKDNNLPVHSTPALLKLLDISY